MTEKRDLRELLTEAAAKVKTMTPMEYEQMMAAQRASWVKGEMGLSKSNFRYIDGVKVYDSYEDYVKG